MPILSGPTQLTGTPGVNPNFKYMTTTDNLAKVTTAGYLNQAILEVTPISNGDIIQCLYSVNPVTGAGSFAIFTVAINGATGQITLTAWSDIGNVLLPVTSGDFAVFNGTAGQIKDAGFLPSNASETVVVMQSGPATASDLVRYVDSTGTIQDSGILSSTVVLLTQANTFTGSGAIILAKANGTESSNAVTASGNAGVITTSSLTTGGGASYAITWTNTFIKTTSVIGLTIQGGTNTTENITFSCVPGAGSAVLTIYNNTAATALNGTIFIGYTVF